MAVKRLGYDRGRWCPWDHSVKRAYARQVWALVIGLDVATARRGIMWAACQGGLLDDQGGEVRLQGRFVRIRCMNEGILNAAEPCGISLARWTTECRQGCT